ncbi:coenzyme PQQ (Pyrroloquinoline quinone) biosynthesis protein C/D [Aurantimonas manganoxydans SI85-9A1]|uniref:Pyrroloquinoline-quinone synthase n=1 Tax=Aurantimonas manganoxydans (strain ATCC BAA-1229 / DSM 21871 / SI85-9A1) TaxID=287752 RepID=Q1YKD7_AURMS|nr:pyrroloquinoline-quinone synthase PqqC [Aurantimonas manganoxydans]EAS50586.1 coenzyme PQQ (Pyrroloquinoline quinone) biosynthesis protein C/D [Aurantimonas manganoxydans SI85-9A1]
MTAMMDREAFEAALRQIGAERYHHLHPFQQMLQNGQLSREQVQAWALNRYYYQSQIPVKDSHILARLQTTELRREWRQRIIDHDGQEASEGQPAQRGGIEKWIALTDGVGLDRAYVESGAGILPGTRFAVDAYVHFVQEKTLLEAIASSLTELFSPNVIGTRVRGMLEHYDFISRETLAYFDKRPVQAKRDSDFALEYCLENARRPEEQEAVLNALRFKCHVLWAQLDALCFAYVAPGLTPADAWQPGTAEKENPRS